MADSANVWDKKWDEFFARTQQLPVPERTRDFLALLPPSARVLDFGCGSGRWCAAFFRDRPDLTIDAVDGLIEKATLIPANSAGERIKADFVSFCPSHAYNGLWAYAVLFFIPRDKQPAVFQRLTQALRPGGVFEFTMVEEGAPAISAGFHGMSEEALKNWLAEAELTILSMDKLQDAQYGPTRITIPTFHVRAQKSH